MKKFLIFSLFLVLISLSACGFKKSAPEVKPEENNGPVACTMEAKICPDGTAVGRTAPNCEFQACPVTSPLTYINTIYGFKLELAQGWENYTVATSSVEFGTKVLIRHPKWTKENLREDISLLVYPLAQWEKWAANNFDGYPTAAPIGPTERGRNDQYVIATAPRYNYDFLTGFEEVEEIIKTLKPVTILMPSELIKTDCGSCPLLSKPAPDFCKDGELVTSVDNCGCQSAPTCAKNNGNSGSVPGNSGSGVSGSEPGVIEGGSNSNGGSVGLANPASTYCVKQGGKSVIMNSPDGSQYGNCILPSGKTCEEWAYFRGECK